MASEPQKMKYDDLTYTQIIDPTLGGNLPKAKVVEKKSTTKKDSVTKASRSASSASKKSTTSKNISTKKKAQPVRTKASKNAVSSKTSSKSVSTKKAVVEPNVKDDKKPKMKYDDLTYTQIIDPTLGGNLPSKKKELEITKVPDAELNREQAIQEELEQEVFSDDPDGIGMLISTILVMVLIVVGIILAANLLK